MTSSWSEEKTKIRDGEFGKRNDQLTDVDLVRDGGRIARQVHATEEQDLLVVDGGHALSPAGASQVTVKGHLRPLLLCQVVQVEVV